MASSTEQPTELKSEEREQLGKALGRLASGVYIATAQNESERIGLLATWVSQVAFAPPMVSIAVNKERPLKHLLTEGAVFSLNILSKTNMDIFKAFAKPAPAHADERFNGLNLKPNDSAGPVFADAISYINCKVATIAEAGDHMVVLAEVFGGEMLNPDLEPMVHLRKSGFQY